MKRSNKKGFTIVELVIVIAVIAILAAVLIPTIAGIVKKANLSADKHAVSQINKQLAIVEAETKPTNLQEVVFALEKADFDIEDYKALTADHYFYWVKSQNKVVLADSTNTVVFPENSDISYKVGDWCSLSGAVVTADTWTTADNGTTANIKSGAEFVDFMAAYNSGETKATTVTNVTLTGDIDMMSANASIDMIQGTFKISGDATLYNLRSDSNAFVSDYMGENYGYGFGGLFGSIGKYGYANITVSGITIDGASVGDTQNSEVKGKHSGLIAGNVYSNSDVTIENVTIKNSSVTSFDKVGALIGYLCDGNVTLNGNITVENTNINGGFYVAQLIGLVGKNETVDVEGANINTSKNVTCTLNKDTAPGATWNEYKYEGQLYATGQEPATTLYACATSDYWWVGGYVKTEVEGKTIYVTSHSKTSVNIPTEE